MARPGVTFDDVKNAANDLKELGKNITIENIRSILGTGSISTINKYLQLLKKSHDSTAKITSKENPPEELISLLKQLWERVIDASSERVAVIEKQYQQEIASLKQELEKYKMNNKRWQKLYNEWRQENNKLMLEQEESLV